DATYRICKHFFLTTLTATPEIYTLSLHDALPICSRRAGGPGRTGGSADGSSAGGGSSTPVHRSPATTGTPPVPGIVSSAENRRRSEEHTSELQSRGHLVCRLLLEKKKDRVRRIRR